MIHLLFAAVNPEGEPSRALPAKAPSGNVVAAGTALLCFLAGCAAVAVSGASQGISYTINNVAYRTFTFSEEAVHEASLQALKRMRLPPSKVEKKIGRRLIYAKTKELDIRITVTPVTSKATKISVNAKRNFFLKDRSVAVEIINQTAVTLGTR